MSNVKVLFVCMGNICRSPTAEGVFRHVVQQRGLHRLIEVDSAGTVDSHAGESPDARAQETARNHGVELGKIRARKVNADDYGYFDYIVAMDRDNLDYLTRKCPPEHAHKLGLLLPHAPSLELDEVPDPYFGPRNGFERVFAMVWTACEALLDNLINQHELRT